MVLVPTRAFGWVRKTFVAPEATYGTPIMPLAAYSLAALDVTFTPKQERLFRTDTTGIRSYQNTRFSGRKSAEWSLRKYMIPSGVAGTAPDDDDLLLGAFGTRTTGLTSTVRYVPNDTVLQGLSIFSHVGHLMQGVYGAAVNQLVMNFNGTDFSTFEFSGPAKDYVWAGSTTLSAAANKSVTNVKVADGNFYSSNVIVELGAQKNGVTGYKILSLSANGTMKISPALAVTVASGATISPFGPAMSLAGDALHGIAGSFTATTGAVTITSAAVTLNNNLQLRSDEYGVTTPSAIILDRMRTVTFTLELYLTKSIFYLFGEGANFKAQNITLVAGSAAAKRFRVLMATGEFEVPKITVPGSEGEVTLSVAGAAQSTSAGIDDIKLEAY